MTPFMVVMGAARMSFMIYYVTHVPRTWLNDLIPWYRRKLKAVEDWFYSEIRHDMFYHYPRGMLDADADNSLRYVAYVTGNADTGMLPKLSSIDNRQADIITEEDEQD